MRFIFYLGEEFALDPKTLYDHLTISPEPILQMAENNQLYQVVSVACQLALFEALTQKQSARDLARRKRLDEVTTIRLLDILTHLGYLEENDGLYQISRIAENYLQPNNLLYLGHHFSPDFPPGSLGFQIMNRLEKYPGCKKSPEPDWNPERLRQIGVSSLNGSIQATIAAIDLSNTRQLLDLGGGHGFYSIALAQKYPALSVTLFDLPQIVALTQEYVQEFRVADRISLVAGDFLQEDIGTGYDAVLCANILHGTKRAIILDKVWHALNHGGRIIVKCRIADCPATLANALAKLIWQVRGGKELFPRAEWHGFLADSGFEAIETHNIHGIFATITGIKK